MKIIGITGGVGSGKTQILTYIEEHYSARIILADKVAHFLQEPGQVCFEPLKTLLGHAIIDGDGFIDKSKMAQMIFANKELLEQVNEIVHPAVQTYIEEQILFEKEQKKIEFLFIEAALLIEAGYERVVDELWYIWADEKTRMQRLKNARNYSEEKTERIMRQQLQDVEFRNHCSFVIDNSGSLDETYLQIDEKLGEYLCRNK